MILDVAMLNIRPGQVTLIEEAFAQAQAIITSMPGYPSHDLNRCLDDPRRYLLLVECRSRFPFRGHRVPRG